MTKQDKSEKDCKSKEYCYQRAMGRVGETLCKTCSDYKPKKKACIPVEPEPTCPECGHKEHGEEDNKCLEVVYQDEFGNKQYCQCMGSIEGVPDLQPEKHCTYGEAACPFGHRCEGCEYKQAPQMPLKKPISDMEGVPKDTQGFIVWGCTGEEYDQQVRKAFALEVHSFIKEAVQFVSPKTEVSVLAHILEMAEEGR